MNQEIIAWMKSGRATNWNLIPYYERAIQWIKDNTVGKGGVAISDKQKIIHTGITRELIPILVSCGEPELASQYKRCAKEMKGGAYDELVGPKNLDDAINYAKYEESSYLKALALKFLFNNGHNKTKIDKMLMKEIEPMDKAGTLYDSPLGRILPAALCIFAELCYKLGHYRRGDKLLQTVCALQRSSGGWFGSSRGRKQSEYISMMRKYVG